MTESKTYLMVTDGTKSYLVGPFDSLSASSDWLKANNPKNIHAKPTQMSLVPQGVEVREPNSPLD